MKTFRLFLILTALAAPIFFASTGTKARNSCTSRSGVTVRAHNTPAALQLGNNALDQDLQRAFVATAKYNSVKKAEADGYILDVYEEGEGQHYFHPAFYDDGVFDIEHPEALLYVPDEKGHLRLAALEYLVPYDPNAIPPAPDGFAGDEDVWRSGDEGFPEWALNVWIWTHNPDGVFSKLNPLVP